MKINKIGLNYSHGQSFAVNRPTGSGDYLLLLFKTPARLILQGNECCTEKNTLIIYKKGTPQYYRAFNSNFINDFIHFDADNDRELNHIALDTLLLLPSIKQVSKIFRDIYMEFISTNQHKEESIDILLRLLFLKISELISYKPKNTVSYDYYDLLINLRSQIYRHPDEKWSITRLAGQLNLSSSHFQRLYKNTFGVTCIADVIACKMEYAKTSLASTGGTVREIASLCGYENEEHFMRQFKREVGVTPSEYRKLLKS